ncbi:hypothetical protein BGZ82_001958, partial [Podila clonocystis]
MHSEESDSVQIQWLKNKVTKKEAISMLDFAITFKYLCENDADEAFTTLLSKSFIAQATRTAVLNNYEIWKRNEGPTFWVSQTATLSLTQTAGELVAEGAHVAKDVVRKSRISLVPPERSAQPEETSRSQGTTLLAGQKHARDSWGELDETPPKTA